MAAKTKRRLPSRMGDARACRRAALEWHRREEELLQNEIERRRKRRDKLEFENALGVIEVAAENLDEYEQIVTEITVREAIRSIHKHSISLLTGER